MLCVCVLDSQNNIMSGVCVAFGKLQRPVATLHGM